MTWYYLFIFEVTCASSQQWQNHCVSVLSYFKWGNYKLHRLPNWSYLTGTKLFSFSWTKNQKWVKVVFGGGRARHPRFARDVSARNPLMTLHICETGTKNWQSVPKTGTACPAPNEYDAYCMFSVGYQPRILRIFGFLCEYLANRSNNSKCDGMLVFLFYSQLQAGRSNLSIIYLACDTTTWIMRASTRACNQKAPRD